MTKLIKDQIHKLATDPKILLFGNNFEPNNLQSTSYDLRIGSIFLKGKIYSHDFNIDEKTTIDVNPSEIVTLLTLEEVNMPKYLTGTVFAINSLSSTGFLILNPGHIDPGYKGPISICAINLSSQIQPLYLKMKIFTIIFDKLESNAEGYKNLPEKTRKEFEISFLKDRASKLSSSFIDLITLNQHIPNFKDQIEKVIKEKMNKTLEWSLKIIGSIVAILGLTYAVTTFYNNNENKKLKENNQNLNLQLQLQKDTIKELRINKQKEIK